MDEYYDYMDEGDGDIIAWRHHCRYIDADELEASRKWPDKWPDPGGNPGS